METTIIKFMDIISNIKIFHWKTKSYAEHKASDSLYNSLNSHMDKFAEVYLGSIGGRFDFTTKKTIHIADRNIVTEVKNFIKFINSLNLSGDLSNIREETVADCNQFLYLMSFK